MQSNIKHIKDDFRPIPVYDGYDIQELKSSPNSKSNSPENLPSPETQDTDHSQISGEDVNRHLHQLSSLGTQQQQPTPPKNSPNSTSSSIERPVSLCQPGFILRKPRGVLINVKSILSLKPIEAKNPHKESQHNQMDHEYSQPENIVPPPRLFHHRHFTAVPTSAASGCIL